MKGSKLFVPILFAVVVLAAAYQVACGGSSLSNPSPTAPTPPGGGGANVTISIVGMQGAQSFSPNPATVAQGQTVAFRNNDSTTHHIVQDAGAFDTGNLAPGATSAAITINTMSALPFHCSIHPTMVGTINGAVSGAPGGPGY